jgi:chromate transporter
LLPSANLAGVIELLDNAGARGPMDRMSEHSGAAVAANARGNAAEVLLVFLRLGLTSFGGPIAHLGYFHEEFVVRRKWLDEQAYVDLVALCQFLPGPASSQVGFSIGLMRAGYGGALAAWTGFTLPWRLRSFFSPMAPAR